MIDIGKSTHLGNIRQINEDAFLVTQIGDFNLLIVADGMGGHNAGEVASKMAVNKIAEHIEQNLSDDAEDMLRSAICYANKEIYYNAAHVRKNRGMGTTVVCAIVKPNGEAMVANVGDSRAYVLSDNHLRQITVDHSYVQELVDKKMINVEDARKHPRRNLITRAVGTAKRVIVDVFNLTLKEGDRLLLCSDGLTSHVMDDALKKTLSSNSEPKTLAYVLEKQALKNGGADNITMVIAKQKGKQ